jgi:hypothetical protein
MRAITRAPDAVCTPPVHVETARGSKPALSTLLSTERYEAARRSRLAPRAPSVMAVEKMSWSGSKVCQPTVAGGPDGLSALIGKRPVGGFEVGSQHSRQVAVRLGRTGEGVLLLAQLAARLAPD